MYLRYITDAYLNHTFLFSSTKQQPGFQAKTPSVPGYANFGGLRILVSPFMNFNVQSKTTDILMVNSRNLGALIVDKKPHVREWDEPQFDIKNIGIEESYLRSVCSTDMQVWSSTATLEAPKRDVDAGRRSIMSVGAHNMAFEEF